MREAIYRACDIFKLRNEHVVEKWINLIA
jgi:hypothetical protein